MQSRSDGFTKGTKVGLQVVQYIGETRVLQTVQRPDKSAVDIWTAQAT